MNEVIFGRSGRKIVKFFDDWTEVDQVYPECSIKFDIAVGDKLISARVRYTGDMSLMAHCEQCFEFAKTDDYWHDDMQCCCYEYLLGQNEWVKKDG